MTYCIYHVPGVKIGVTNNIKYRVEQQQGYNESEYEIVEMSDDINYISKKEHELQRKYGYRVDRQLYKDLHNNNFKQLNNMKINITEMTTTFPCPVNKLKGHLMDNIGMSWDTVFGRCAITNKSIEWIIDNVKSSQFTNERCYIYNRAFARWFDNNNAHELDNAKQMNDQYNGRTRSGALSSAGINEESYECRDEDNRCECRTNYSSVDFISQFDQIREWAQERGLYDKGDVKTQTLKLLEEVYNFEQPTYEKWVEFRKKQIKLKKETILPKKKQIKNVELHTK